MTASRFGLNLLIAVATAAIVVLGVWIAGGVVDDFRAAMGLTAAWFLLAGVASLVVARSERFLRVPVVGGYLIAAIAAGGYLGFSTLHERVVDERVVAGSPTSALPSAAAGESAPASANLEEASGAFRSGEHDTSGRARVIRMPNGRRVLTLTRFETAAGPDLRVRILPRDRSDGAADDAIDLGALKGNRGNQQYALPRDLRPGRHTVVIWCRAFSALFGAASLRPS